MRIIVLEHPAGEIVAREDQLGRLEGEFFLRPDNAVWYRSPWDTKIWFVNRDLDSFRKSAAAWSRYCQRIEASKSETAHDEVAETLLAELQSLGSLDKRDDGFWPVIASQVKDGTM